MLFPFAAAAAAAAAAEVGMIDVSNMQGACQSTDFHC